MLDVKVLRITEIHKHPFADTLEVAIINDCLSVVKKGTVKVGEPVVFLPTNAILPDPLIKDMGLCGRLGGKKKNRIKTRQIRQIKSQGIILPLVNFPQAGINCALQLKDKYGTIKYRVVKEGADVGNVLGIQEFIPHIPKKVTIRRK